MSRLFWRGDERPPTMYRDGRPVFELEPDEQVYIRWFNNHFKGGIPDPDQVFVPDQSANRVSGGGRCWYVLLPEPQNNPDNPDKPDDARRTRCLCMGILGVQASVAEKTTMQADCQFDFRFEHDPIKHNYYHCELHVYRDGERLTKAMADGLKRQDRTTFRAAKKWFRTEIAQAFHASSQSVEVLRSEVTTGGKK
ncbi:MAG: hypothetical protein RJS97_08695 [Parvibaculaceae bacterium]